MNELLAHHVCVYVCVCVCVCVFTHIYTYIYISHLYTFIWQWTFRLPPILATMNCAALNTGCMYLFELPPFPDTCPGVELLDYIVTLFLVFWGTSKLFSVVAVPIYIPTNSVGGFPSLHSPSAFVIYRLFKEVYSGQCEVVPHCSFDLHFSNN